MHSTRWAGGAVVKEVTTPHPTVLCLIVTPNAPTLPVAWSPPTKIVIGHVIQMHITCNYLLRNCASPKHLSLQWRHNGSDGVSNHLPPHCLLDRLFRRRSKKTSKLRVIGLCLGNSTLTGEFPAQMADDAENGSIWWRHHVIYIYILIIPVKPIQHIAFGYPDSSYCQAKRNLVIYCVMFFRCGVNINYAQGTTFIFDWRMKNNGKFWERRCLTQGVISHPRGDLHHISIDSCQTALIIWDARTRHPIFSVLEYSL